MQYDSYVSEENFNSDAGELYTSLVGCYNGLQGTMYREWALTEVRSDNTKIHKTNTSASPYTEILSLDFCVPQTNNSLVEEYWDAVYSNITNCNIVIRDIDVVEDEDTYNEYLAEAMFLRSYHYFNLVRLFSGVPLVLTKLTVTEANTMDRNTEDEIYDQIISDLEQIVDNKMLPVERDSEEKGRATEVAAKALLAKVYMTRYEVGSSDYNKAESLLKSVIDVLGTSLISYESIFDIANEMNSEIIFAVRYKACNSGIGCPFGNEFAPMQSGTNVVNGDGKSYNYPTTEIREAYEQGDLRKDVSVADSYINSSTGETTEDPYIKKYLSDGQTADDGESDWPVIRLADVILLYAELLNENGNASDAVSYTNLIRSRAGLADLDEDATLNKSSIRSAIQSERRVELAFENQRWFDLVRWGMAVDVVNTHYSNEESGVFYSTDNPELVSTRVVLPIPYTVININPSMSQNIGY